MTAVVLTQRDNAVATVTLNRPDKMNALNQEVWVGLAEAFEALAADHSVRVVILRGAGTAAFAPGADITEFESHRATAAQAQAYDVIMRRALNAVRDCPHPTIALIYGPCVGGGLELAAQCDLRIAARSGRFGVPISKISVVMAQPELAGLQRLIGSAKVLEILLEARIMDAEEALRIGLVNRIVDEDKAEEEALATAKRISQGAPLVHRWHRAFVRQVESGAALSAEQLAEAYAFLSSEDYREGLAAFAEKRKPVFKGV